MSGMSRYLTLRFLQCHAHTEVHADFYDFSLNKTDGPHLPVTQKYQQGFRSGYRKGQRALPDISFC
jgi:hypothetical protein